ncbi:universal stress protein [Micromonospora costi]|uniref:Universal stress protein n=1 Tax=Micromonospora costi TaxID=1530042 RepID=A0A3B0AB62_9ACTN|nr:universal stress protein [Micromonospora costi]RKN57710.1 universal stress protein [Micromonospora costi]
MTAAAGPAVLVGLGSDRNLPVVQLAAREAATHDRPLHLVHAFDWSAAFQADTVAAPRDQAEDLIARANDLARDVEPELTVTGEIVEGSAVSVLLRRSEQAFMLAVGDGGMATCEGCVPADAPAVQLAARASCPVLVVRRDPPPKGPVLVGVDGSPSSNTALEWAYDCAARRGSRLLAVRVVEPDEDADEIARQLDDVVHRAADRHPDVPTECHAIRGDPGSVLVEQSRSAQLALVAARGDEPGRGMLGAVAQTLLYHAPAPVVVVRGMTRTAPQGRNARPTRDQRP